jgi:hypothetical protein
MTGCAHSYLCEISSHGGLGIIGRSCKKENTGRRHLLKGASLKDPKRLFNAGLDAKSTRAIDFTEGDTIDESALKALIRAAVASASR